MDTIVSLLTDRQLKDSTVSILIRDGQYSLSTDRQVIDSIVSVLTDTGWIAQSWN